LQQSASSKSARRDPLA